MNFADAIDNQMTRTENNMITPRYTGSKCVDLFFKVGASRGQDIIPTFIAAFLEDEDLAIRIALWARDIRQGAGERQIFKDILGYLEQVEPELAMRVLYKVSELGRWDDLLIKYTNRQVQKEAFSLIKNALYDKDALCAKWMPRKGLMAVKLRNFLDMTPKQYRKTLVNLTDVVETKMCAKKWSEINYSHVPSLASARYKSAFYRNDEDRYTKYVDKLVNGDKSVKVNVGAIYPYDILKGLISLYYTNSYSKTELNHIQAQWDALPNYVNASKVFPMIDVSGSMTVGITMNLTALDIAVSLGLYFADKNTGAFKDLFLAFSGDPNICKVEGNIIQKITQIVKSDWGFNTDIEAAFDRILQVTKEGNVSQEDMPEYLLIFSDMQFDQCVDFDEPAIANLRRQYERAGYQMPQVVFWNINARDNVPVKFNEKGVALVSGFSPVIVKSILSCNKDSFNPEVIMKETVMIDRYDF